jgi:glycosyltransferase involved in cell wall biosynthesis
MTPAEAVPDDPVALDLTLIAPAHNEQENVDPLLERVAAALEPLDRPFEMIVVDDNSTDGTAGKLAAARRRYPWLRVLQVTNAPAGRGLGQSAAFLVAIGAARGRLIGFLDADLQNDPADLPEMLRRLEREQVDLVQGDRSANRRDTLVRRVSSWVGRTFRRLVLGDSIRDTGCSLRLMRSEVARQLPLQYKGMHRFIPFYAGMLGYQVVESPVRHHPRTAGEAKYGIWNRALPGLVDLLAVRWMRSRLRRPEAKAMEAPAGADR